jgi:DHA3 family tetracycline resistance protein-like MFS transporter
MSLARRKWNPGKPVITLYVMTINRIVVIGSLILFAFTRNFPLAVGLLCLISVMRSINNPYYTAWVNMHLSSDVRATVLSMSSQVDALGQIVGGPVLGLVGNLWGIPAALVGSAALLSPVLGLFARAFTRERQVGLEPQS